MNALACNVAPVSHPTDTPIPVVLRFATPCIYLAPERLGPRGQLILPLNPAYGLITNFRSAILGTPFDWYAFAISGTVAVILLFIGLTYFRRVERSFADVI